MRIGVRVSVGLIVATASIASAQGVGDDADAEIVVTASRRAQTITEIPIAVSAISGDTISNNDIRDLEELSASIPNFKAGNGGYLGEAIAIRGLGTGQDRAFEQAVGLYVDGIYFPRSRVYRSAFFDLERVEVMRGPQAVLQGLNSTAGAISVLSRKTRPGAPTEFDLAAGGEFEYGGFNGEAIASFSPVSWLGVRAAARYADDGPFYKNSVTGREENARRDVPARITLVAALGDDTELTIKGDHTTYSKDGGEGEAVGRASPLAGLFPALTDDGIADWTRTGTGELLQAGEKSGFFRSGVPRSKLETDGVMFDLTHHVGGGAWSLTGGHYKSRWDHDIDGDATDATFIEGSQYERYKQSSLSGQYVSEEGKPFEYIVGAYYQNSNLNFVLPFGVDATAFGIPLGIGYTPLYDLDADLYSTFGTATYHVSPSFRVVGGVRYVSEKKKLDVSSSCSWRSLTDFSAIPDAAVGVPVYAVGLCSDPDMDVPGGVHRERTSDNFMYEGALQYDLNPNAMVYAKYSTSAKAGGYSAATEVDPDEMEYGDESARGLEAGIKASLLDNKMTLAFAAFRTKFRDLQLKSDISDPTTGQTITVISNAGRSRSQGVEFEARYSPARQLLLELGLGLLDGEFTDFRTAPCGESHAPPAGTDACDFSGLSMPFAARVTGNVGLRWQPPLTDKLNAIFEPSLQYSSGYFTDGTLDEGGHQGSWTTLDVRVGIADSGNRWSLSIIGKNLTNRRIISGYQPTILYPVVFYQDPRTVGARLTYHFE